jgi:hypothetical protein
MRFRHFALTVAVLGLIGAATVAATPRARRQDTARPDDAAAVVQFNAAVTKYMALRQRLRSEIKGPTAGSSAAELNRASDDLASAIQRARVGARPGNIFVVPMAAVVKKRVDDLVRRDNLAAVLANIDDEEATVKTPTIHLRFPAAAMMATMPPALLAALPALPKELEYRIVGNALVLRDVDAALIIDYIPAAVPRKP